MFELLSRFPNESLTYCINMQFKLRALLFPSEKTPLCLCEGYMQKSKLWPMRKSWQSFNVRPHLQSHGHKKFDKFCQKDHCNGVVGVVVLFVFRCCNKDACRKKRPILRTLRIYNHKFKNILYRTFCTLSTEKVSDDYLS